MTYRPLLTNVQRALAARGDAVDLLEQAGRRPACRLRWAPTSAPPPVAQLVRPRAATPTIAGPMATRATVHTPTRASQRPIWLLSMFFWLALLTLASALWRPAHSMTSNTATQPTDSTVAGLQGAAQPVPVAQSGTPVPVTPSSDFRYDAPPSISRDNYIAIYCLLDSPACPEAGAMYNILATPDENGVIDPAIEAAQGMHETGLGTNPNGVGRQPTIRADGTIDPCCGGRNLHGVQCFSGDTRVADLSVGWGNNCAAVYPDYATSVRTWKGVILREYVAEGKDTPAKAVWKYAPIGKDGNNPPAYIADMENWITCWRAKSPSTCFEERGIAVRQWPPIAIPR